jgi:carbon monoxide dehydrogenase subunit G
MAAVMSGTVVPFAEECAVHAPADFVWSLFRSPEQVAPLLVGAVLEERLDDNSYRGSFRFTYGPTSATFSGTLTVVPDDVARHARIEASGIDRLGRTEATIECSAQVLGADGDPAVTEIHLEGRVEVTGVLAPFFRSAGEKLVQRTITDLLTSAETLARGDELPAPRPRGLRGLLQRTRDAFRRWRHAA